jgi:DNA-binding HxlR family transcriptional regulator
MQATRSGRDRAPSSAGAADSADSADAVPPADAAVRELLERLGDKWTVTVICRLDSGPLRFNELRRATEGITQRMLSATVRRLERDGLLSRTVYPTVPPQVTYALTDSGRSLHTVLYRLVGWTQENLEVVTAARERYDAERSPSDPPG